jgi:hypothetical protein
MVDLTLIYFDGCPNEERVRRNLLAAGYSFKTVRQDDLPSGHPFKAYSSPTILDGEKVVFGTSTASGEGGCSLEIPSVSELRSRIGKPRQGLGGIVAQGGSILAGLTVGLCPVCIPAVGAFLAALGLDFLAKEAVLKPILVAVLALTVGGLFSSYRKEHGRIYLFVLGVVLAATLYLGRYVYVGYWTNAVLEWSGIIGLVVVSFWNLRLRRTASCAVCRSSPPAKVAKGGRSP